jgi:FAD/FMN-containing dehydrogenase
VRGKDAREQDRLFDLVGSLWAQRIAGVVTEATLRFFHRPRAGGLSAGFRDMRAAAHAIQAVFAGGFLPAAVAVAARFTLQAAREFLPGASFPPGGAHLLIEVDGQPVSVQAEIGALAKLLRERRATKIETAANEAECERLWDLRRAFSESLKATGLKKLNEDVVVPRGRLVELVRFARGLQERSRFPIACFGHAGDETST